MAKRKFAHDPRSRLNRTQMRPIGWPMTIYQYSGRLYEEDVDRFNDLVVQMGIKQISRHVVKSAADHFLFVEAAELDYKHVRRFDRDFAHAIR